MKMITRSSVVNTKRRKRTKKPGIRLSTLKRDKEILKRLRQGKAPKEVAYELGLSSVWVVYDALRRQDTRKLSAHSARFA